MINQNQNKKRERNAPLFITKVSINTDGNLIINHEYPNPKTIVERLERERNDESVIHEVKDWTDTWEKLRGFQPAY